MKTESLFVKYYDIIMEEIDYTFWFEIMDQYVKDNTSLLDLGCGTGTLLIYLTKNDLSLTGVDFDDEILQQAKNKARINHLQIDFVHSDMLEYKNYKNFDYITCFFDTVNFLDSLEKIDKFFSLAYDNLKDDGILFFDFFSKEAFNESNKRVIKRKDQDVEYLWKIKIKKPNMLKHTIKIEKKKEIYLEYYFDFLSLIPNNFQIIEKKENDDRIALVLKKRNG